MRLRTLPTVLAAVAAAALPVAAGIPAQGAASSWRLVFTHHYGTATNFSGYLTGVANSKRDAWAFGGSDLSGATPGRPVARHWDGKSWRASSLPGGLTGEIGAASAVSASSVWAITPLGGNILRWNGRAWSVAKHITGAGQLTGITAISSKDVWVFGGGGATGGLGTWHFNGSTWKHVTGSANGLEKAGALSSTNIWAIGSASSPANIIVHYRGTTWRTVTAKALSGLQFEDIVALSSTNVWAAATAGGTAFKPVLVHFNGSKWVRVTVPWAVNLGPFTQDGRGGLWLTAAGRSNQSWVLHRSRAGNWRREQITAGHGANLVGLALIPGTTSLWGVGLVQGTSGSDAAIWAHGKSA